MSDLPPMEPCPYEKRGRHHLMAMFPVDGDGDLTLSCSRCGATRRMALNGLLPDTPMDDWLPSRRESTLP